MAKAIKINKRQRRGLYKNVSSTSFTCKFTKFVIKSISKSKSNIVMTVLARRYQEKYDLSLECLRQITVIIRVYLEDGGYISYASVNRVDRRIKYVTPTGKFPTPDNKNRLNKLIDATINYVRATRADDRYDSRYNK
jgi:hypothetical protein